MSRVRPAAWGKPDRDALVRHVARGLSEGTLSLADINDLTDRQVQELLTPKSTTGAAQALLMPLLAPRGGRDDSEPAD